MFATITINTSSRTELIDITSEIQALCRNSGIQAGCVIIYVPHTTAAVTINEHADPSVARDIEMELNKIVPFADNYRHAEGNSAAHIKSTIIGVSKHLILQNGSLVLGTWQGIFFCEFDGPRKRKVHVKIISD